MVVSRLIYSASISAMLISGAQAVAVTYTATLLDPPDVSLGSIGRGISNGMQVGRVTFRGPPQDTRAVLWKGTSGNVVFLDPLTEVDDISGASVVGSGNGNHALLWTGDAASAVDLHPAGFFSSKALGVSNDSQVGVGDGHALLWRGTAASVVDLHPPNFLASRAEDVWGDSQVGAGNTANGKEYALLWKGTAASVVSLNPPGFDQSTALGIWEERQVGSGRGDPTGDREHALLWNSTPESAVDLNPTGFAHSHANGVSGNFQVGWGKGSSTGNKDHALVWSGSAESAVDLHPFLAILPIAMHESYAYDVDDDGTIVGYALSYTVAYAVLWTPGPAPPVLVGDYNKNGIVDAADYVVWRDQSGQVVTACSGADGNCNGFVDTFDYQRWRESFGRTLDASLDDRRLDHPATDVPETSTITLSFVIMLLGVAMQRMPRRKLGRSG